jgi:hypothetical protein
MKILIISFLFLSTIICYGQYNNSSDNCFNSKQYDHQILNDWYSIIGNSHKKEFFIEVKKIEFRTIYCCLFDSTTYTVTVVSYNINKDEVKYNFVEKEYYLFSNFSIKNVELKSGLGEGVLYNPKFIPIKEVISQDCCG